jgi:hypothetical protein
MVKTDSSLEEHFIDSIVLGQGKVKPVEEKKRISRIYHSKLKVIGANGSSGRAGSRADCP